MTRTPLETELLELTIGVIAFKPEVTCHSLQLCRLLCRLLDDTCRREEVNNMAATGITIKTTIAVRTPEQQGEEVRRAYELGPANHD